MDRDCHAIAIAELCSGRRVAAGCQAITGWLATPSLFSSPLLRRGQLSFLISSTGF